MREERLTFEFCPDTANQSIELYGMTYGVSLDLEKARSVCRAVGVRARVLKHGTYQRHIFEDGSVG
jgi:hypothetical protein